jgi:hypothetical protein
MGPARSLPHHRVGPANVREASFACSGTTTSSWGLEARVSRRVRPLAHLATS